MKYFIMKSLTNYIEEKLIVFHPQVDEKLVVNKDYNIHKYHPTTWDELRQIIEERYKKQGPGTAEAPIDFNDIDVSEVNSFYDNKKQLGIFEKTDFEYIDISNWDVSNVTNMHAAFWWCKHLKSIGDLSNWNVSNVEYMHSMFNGCTHLKSVGDLSDWDVSKVKNMIHMFYDSRIINIPDWYKE